VVVIGTAACRDVVSACAGSRPKLNLVLTSTTLTPCLAHQVWCCRCRLRHHSASRVATRAKRRLSAGFTRRQPCGKGPQVSNGFSPRRPNYDGLAASLAVPHCITSGPRLLRRHRHTMSRAVHLPLSRAVVSRRTA
jgi:hypothetical protein